MSDNINSQQSYTSDLSPPPTEYEKYGYEICGVEEINPRFICIYCSRLMCDPIQLTECGHRCCRGCFEVRAERSADGNIKCPCPDCGEITNKTQIMSDKAFKKELDNLSIICFYRIVKDCPWIGLVKDYQTHLDETHIHYICPACQSNLPSKSTLDEHIRTCPEIYRTCKLGELCTADMIPKEEFLDHLHSEKHQETINKFLTGEYDLPEPVTTVNNEENRMSRQIDEDINPKLDHLLKEVPKLSTELVDLNSKYESTQREFNKVVQELNDLHRMLNERISIKQSLQPNQEQIQKALQELDELYNNVQYISTDGTLTWRVEGVSEKMADAQSERVTSIYSPIFYSSPTDQTGNNRHITDSFYPDVKSNSFQRPKENANTASGIPKFAPLTTLLQDDSAYVRENTLYLKVIVALNETPKTMLPFLLTLNPALPNYVQDNLISQEASKQQQQQQQQQLNTTATS